MGAGRGLADAVPARAGVDKLNDSDRSPRSGAGGLGESLTRPDRATEDLANESALQATAVFVRRARAVPARQRLTYRTGLVILILSNCRSQSLGLSNLHLLTWATRSRRTRAMFGAWWNGQRFVGSATERLEPELTLSLALLVADGLIKFTNVAGRRVGLTELGRELADGINSADVYEIEKGFLGSLDGINDAKMSTRLGVA